MDGLVHPDTERSDSVYLTLLTFTVAHIQLGSLAGYVQNISEKMILVRA